MKYQWNDSKLQKKAKTYTNLMLITMAVVLACLLLLPENYKVVNIAFIVVACLFWYLSYHTQAQDKKLKKPLRKIEHIDKL